MYGNTVRELAAVDRQRDRWNRLAPHWGDWHDFLASWMTPITSAMLSAARMEKGFRILDVGCGMGELGLSAAASGGRVIGVDLAPDMIRYASKRAATDGLKNYKARVAEVSALPFEEHRFEVVLARNLVTLLPSMKSGIKHLAHVLAPGRRLVIAEWGPLEKNPWAAVAIEAVARAGEWRLLSDDEPGPFRCAEPKTLASLFRDADVNKDYSISEVTGEVRFASPAHYWRFLSEVFEPLASALAGRLGARRAAIKAAVFAGAKAHVRRGRPVFGWSAWVASGTKHRRRPQKPMKVHVVYEDQHGRVWHEHDSVYPEPKGAKPPFKSFAEILPRGYRLGFD